MKTRFIVELETKNLHPLYETDEDVGDETKIVTDEVEKDIHKFFEDFMNQRLDDLINDEIIDSEISIEGYDRLEDYGEVTLRIEEVND